VERYNLGKKYENRRPPLTAPRYRYSGRPLVAVIRKRGEKKNPKEKKEKGGKGLSKKKKGSLTWRV